MTSKSKGLKGKKVSVVKELRPVNPPSSLVGNLAPFSAREVADIIIACKASSVLSFSYGGLSLSFQALSGDDSLSNSDSVAPLSSKNSPLSPKAEVTETELVAARARLADVAAEAEDSRTIEQVNDRELYLAQLAINDPVAYEALVETAEEMN